MSAFLSPQSPLHMSAFLSPQSPSLHPFPHSRPFSASISPQFFPFVHFLSPFSTPISPVPTLHLSTHSPFPHCPFLIHGLTVSSPHPHSSSPHSFSLLPASLSPQFPPHSPPPPPPPPPTSISPVPSPHPFPQSPPLIHFPRSPPPPPPPFSPFSTSLFPQSSPLIYPPPPPPPPPPNHLSASQAQEAYVAVYTELNCTIQEDIDLYVLSILYVNQYSPLFQTDIVDVWALLRFSLADSSFVVLRCCFMLSRLAIFPDVSFIKAEHSFNPLFKAALCWAARRW